jgi:cytoskeletal protein CcmA (bactofilin family)
MKRSFHIRFLPIILTFSLALIITTPVAAQGPITGDTIPAGTVVDHDVILVGQNITIDGTVNGNAFVLGNQVAVNGTVDGSIILIGQNAGISGTVSGAVYATAVTLDLTPYASIQRDLYVVTISLTSGDQSVIGRDLYAIGLDSGMNGRVGRDLHTVIGPIQLYNGLMTLLGYDELTIKLHFETPQPGTSPNSSLISAGHHARIQIAEPAPASFDWAKWAISLLRNWAILLAFSLLAVWLMRKTLDLSGEPLLAHPWRTLGIGLLVLVIAFGLIGVTLLLSVFIFAIGLGLNFLGLWQLSLALWVSAYACLAFLLVTLWFFIVYGTKIIAIYVVVTWLFARLFHRDALWLKITALLAGTIVFALLRATPYVGWVFDILVTAAGMGAVWIAYRDSGRKPESGGAALPVKKATKPPLKK